MPIEITKGATILTGDGISLYRMLTLLSGLKLEVKGMRLTRGRTCYAIVKEEYGLKGNKQKVLDQFQKIVDQANSQVERIREV